MALRSFAAIPTVANTAARDIHRRFAAVSGTCILISVNVRPIAQPL
jgi:hypothetical protein